MKIHFKGKYNGDESTLPQRVHPENSVPFKEIEDMRELSKVANIGSLIVTIALFIPFVLLAKDYILDNLIQCALGFLLCNLTLIPHEFLHAICFKEDAYIYSNLSQGLMFVVGTEDMSKSRFILLSMLPNIIFGFIPYILFLFNPKLLFLGTFGLACTSMGFGDYMNVYNAITQVPNGAKTYISGMHSYWYKK